MKFKTIAVFFAALFAYTISIAQTNKPLENFKPSSVNQPGKEFPKVNSEGRVRVQIKARDAQKVQLDISAKK